LLIVVVFFLKKILEKEDLQNNENNDQLDQNYNPDPFTPPRHCPETIKVKME
jgi:hypothetical protein